MWMSPETGRPASSGNCECTFYKFMKGASRTSLSSIPDRSMVFALLSFKNERLS